MVMILLLTLVGAGVGLLFYYAVRVPAITTEVAAWFGQTHEVVNQGDSRRAQLTFVLFVYTAPLALGIIAHGLHYGLRLANRRLQHVDPDDEPFRME